MQFDAVHTKPQAGTSEMTPRTAPAITEPRDDSETSKLAFQTSSATSGYLEGRAMLSEAIYGQRYEHRLAALG